MGHGERAIPSRADDTSPDRDRRKTVSLLVATGLAVCLPDRGAAAVDGSKEPPRPGDALVYADGERKGQPIAAPDLPPGGPLAGAWAQDPVTGQVRSGSRLHRVLVVRLDPADLDGKTKERSADGTVAYSGFCTHAGCPILNWKTVERTIYCHCHSSEFDPRAGGRVVGGPAKRPLAGLPLKLDAAGRLVVAAAFAGKLGVPKA